MNFITQLVRRATRLSQQTGSEPQARVRGKSPRARLRSEALSMLS
jgi:hypothetical protein